MTNGTSLLYRLFSLEGKAVLITGASSGIGGALAVGFAEAGAVVGVHGRDHDRIAAICQQIEAVGGQAVALVANLGSVQSCRTLIEQAQAQMGRLDILINNAATNRRKPIIAVTEDDYESIHATNQRAIFFLSQAAYPLMKAVGGGKIIHIASINVFFALDTVSVYGMTKGAVAQLTKVQAIEWAPDNIQVNCITPGFIRTPLTKPIWEDARKASWLRARIPMRRPAEPEELIGLALMLASPASSYITGQNIVIDGGVLAGGSWDRDGQ
ncbi:MAG: SDR family oxidoreductase [Chloroflexota bacterium]|nr:SDR family oxidoreductase [Chloroflexota bacterium]